VHGGRAIVSGLTPSSGDAGRVRAVAARQPYPVQVVVRSREEFMQSAQSVLAGHGLFPQALVDDAGMVLSGYVLDSLVESAALAWVKNSLPRIVDIRSAMVTRKAVEEHLHAELTRAGLRDTVVVEWLPGMVALSGEGAASPALPAVLDAVRARLRSPVAFRRQTGTGEAQIFIGDASPAAETRRAPTAADGIAPTSAGPFGETLRLRSVTPVREESGTGALPFITTSDGRLYFIGGTLPGGYTLTGIHPDRLEFFRNGVTVAYKLQGR
jgi:type III secretion system YscD/HrpQ family protein